MKVSLIKVGGTVYVILTILLWLAAECLCMQRPLTQRPPDTSWSVGHQKWAESPKSAFPSWAKAIGGLRAKGAELSNLVFLKDLLIPTLYV